MTKQFQLTKSTNKKLFLTNVRCPKCGKQLVTSDLEDYSFLCKDPLRNFLKYDLRYRSFRDVPSKD